MGWFGSIHVRSQSVEHVVAALRVLKQRECYVGKSGADWVGIFDKGSEDSGGTSLADLSRDLSSALNGDYVLGVRQADEGFLYWLYHGGQQLDNHPRGRIKGLLFVRRAILDLCPDKHDKDRVLALLYPKPVVAPVNYRMTEEELRAEIQRNKAKGRALSAEQRRKTTEEQRRIYHTDRFGVEMLSRILGIEHFWQLHSDFSPYDLPPTFIRVD